MRTVTAVSVSRPLRRLIEGPQREGIGLGCGYVDLDGYVLAITAPGAPRMPNGIECDLRVGTGDRVRVGGGAVEAQGTRVIPGISWEPVPVPRVVPRTTMRMDVDPAWLAGRGPGLTPAGDDLLAGYAAGLVLFRSDRAAARRIADMACGRTTSLSATLLRHACAGELPEPAHDLLERGDAGPLERWGHSSGRWLKLGLALACSGDTSQGRYDWGRVARGLQVTFAPPRPGTRIKVRGVVGEPARPLDS